MIKKIDCNKKEFENIKNDRQTYKIFDNSLNLEYLEMCELINGNTNEELEIQITSVKRYNSLDDVLNIINLENFGIYEDKEDFIKYINENYDDSEYLVCRIKKTTNKIIIDDKKLLDLIKIETLQQEKLGLSGCLVYRVKTRDGRMLGGAMYALERGLHAKWLGLLFAIFGGLASFGIGCATQVNAIASVCNENLGIPTWIIGIVVGVLVAMVIFGGIKSIANVCEKLVPFMAFFYVFGCIIILCFNYDFIIPALQTICTLAFKPGAAAGGLIGGGIMQAMHYGVARGLFSNESGMGSAPIAAAAAQTRNPVRQALVSSTGTFWDTVVVCAMTGLVLVTSIMKNPDIDMGSISDGGVLTTLAFNQIPGLGPVILVMGIITFAFSTVLGWAYYGERCIEYFAGKKIMIPYRVLYIIVAVIAPIAPLNLIWLVADILNALMAIPNLIAVLLLSPVIVMETKKYLNNLDMKDDTPVPYEDEV